MLTHPMGLPNSIPLTPNLFKDKLLSWFVCSYSFFFIVLSCLPWATVLTPKRATVISTISYCSPRTPYLFIAEGDCLKVWIPGGKDQGTFWKLTTHYGYHVFTPQEETKMRIIYSMFYLNLTIQKII